jgi:hypothetical protein
MRSKAIILPLDYISLIADLNSTTPSERMTTPTSALRIERRVIASIYRCVDWSDSSSTSSVSELRIYIVSAG